MNERQESVSFTGRSLLALFDQGAAEVQAERASGPADDAGMDAPEMAAWEATWERLAEKINHHMLQTIGPSASPTADWQGDGFPPGHPKHEAAAAATDAAAAPSPAAPAGSSGTGEGVSEHVRNALQILNGILDEDWSPQNLTAPQLDLAAQGIGKRLVLAHEHRDAKPPTKYELEVASSLIGAVTADVSLPGKAEERRQSLLMLRFRLNAALVTQGEPVPPTAEALAQLGIERVGE